MGMVFAVDGSSVVNSHAFWTVKYQIAQQGINLPDWPVEVSTKKLLDTFGSSDELLLIKQSLRSPKCIIL